MAKIFVTVRHPSSPFEIGHKVGVEVAESITKTAKEVRKDLVEEFVQNFHILTGNSIGFKPADFAWGVFDFAEDNQPAITSENWL